MVRAVSRVSRVSGVVMSGPLVAFVDAYRVELLGRGYTIRVAVIQLRQVGRLSRWMDRQGWAASELSEGRLEEFLAVQRADGRHRSQSSRPGLLCLLEVLRAQAVVGVFVQPPAVSDADRLLGSFERYLLSERGLATGTVVGYVAHARRFLDGLPSSGVSAVTAAEVTGAVLVVSGCGWSVSAVQNFVAGLRAFLRFCFLEGVVGADVSGAALAVTGRRRSPLPRWDQPGTGTCVAGQLRPANCLGQAGLRDHPDPAAAGAATR